MATPNISIQPRGIVSTLEPIMYQFTEFTTGTLNIVCQLQYDTTGAGNWVNWGGKMRTAPLLDFAGYFQLHAQDVFNSLPKGSVSDLRQLGDGCCYGGGIGSLPQSFWALVSNWQVRVVAQREYVDPATGFIELDPDEATTNTIIVHEGSPPRRNTLWGATINASANFAEYVMQQDANEGRKDWLWLTDALWQRANRRIEIKVDIFTDEQFYIHTFNGALLNPISQDNKLQIRTFDYNGLSMATREIAWNNGMTNKGMQSIDVGFRSYACAFSDDPQGGEAADFSNVARIEVVNLVSAINNTGFVKSIVWNFKVKRKCKSDGYQRFLWKNQLGGWDMFSSDGKLTSRRKIKHETYQKRVGRSYQSIKFYGSNNWVNTESEIMQVTSQPITKAQAQWFSKIGSSTFTLLRIDMFSELNPQAFGSFDTYEQWRDSGKCNGYIPIIINSSSIKIVDTNKKHQKVSFEYQLAMKNIYPRN